MTLKHRGSLSEKIGILSNDPAGVKILTLRFEVPHELAADPPELYFGIVPPGQEVSRQVKVLATANVNTKVLYAVSNAESLVGRVIEPGLSKTKPAVLEVAVKAPSRPGTYRHSVSITTGLDARPTIRLPVVLSVCNAATVSPERLDFGRFARGQPVTRSIRLTLSEGIRLNVAAAHPNVLDVKIGSPEGQGGARVHLTAKKDIPYGPLRGELRLELGGKQECTLAVPFAGYVTEGKHTQ